jgi:hypothetical protein
MERMVFKYLLFKKYIDGSSTWWMVLEDMKILHHVIISAKEAKNLRRMCAMKMEHNNEDPTGYYEFYEL